MIMNSQLIYIILKQIQTIIVLERTFPHGTTSHLTCTVNTNPTRYENNAFI